MDKNLYEGDFYSWSMEQARLLKEGDYEDLDIDNLVEEISDMGGRHADALLSQLIRLLQHLLKWQYQPERRGRSWRKSIVNSRVEIDLLLNRNPGLKSKLDTMYSDAYKYALRKASGETELSLAVFPNDNPWSFSVVISDDFWPEA